VGGIIQKRLFTEGSEVKAGQVLFQIDPAPYKAALDNAKAALAKAEASITSIRYKAERYKELLDDKAVSRQEYDDAAALLKQAEADIQYWKAMVETASINLKYTSVTAPISGRIGKSSVTEGALVTANQSTALAVIQQLNPMYVDVPQSTTELAQLRRHLEEGRINRENGGRNKVRLFLEDNTQYPLPGELQFRDVTVDPTSATVNLRVTVPNPKSILLPGMFLRAVVEEGTNSKAILIPQQAVFRTPKGESYTLAVDAEGKVQQKMLVVDRAIGDKWLVSSGIGAGERVIVEGMQKVKVGASAKAIPYGTGKQDGGQNTAPPAAKSN
jgi:membrane fusion protein, multidrug efflux system